MQEDFGQFLQKMSTEKISDEYGDPLADMFSPWDEPVTEDAIQAAEHRLGTALPTSFKQFLRILGPGDWAHAGAVGSPEDLDVFVDCWELTGFVGIVGNVRGVGDYLAFNPADPEVDGERPVYYFGHDPFGYARVADSFEIWARKTAEAAQAEEDFYEAFDDAVWEKWEAFQAAQPKKWWQFWR